MTRRPKGVDGIALLGKRMTEARLALSFRRRKEVKQVDIANAVGVAPITVGRWERGEKVPDLLRLPAIAKALQCDPGWLTYGPPIAKVYKGELNVIEPVAHSGKASRGRKQPPPTTERHHTLAPLWYGYDALGEIAHREERRA